MKLRPRTVVSLVIALLAFGLVACSHGHGQESGSQPASGGVRFVFAEQDGGATTFWSANPEEPADRRQLARVSHHPEWGVRAAVSPDGHAIAYTAMAPGARNPDRDAVLTVLDIPRRASRRLATGLDLRTAPVWLGETGTLVVQRRSASGVASLVAITADGRERALLSAAPGHMLFPAGVDQRDGSLYVADLSAAGTSLRVYRGSDGWTDLGRIASGSARGFVVAPDGSAVGFLRPEVAFQGSRYQAAVLDVGLGQVNPLFPEHEREEDTGIAWADGGWIVTSVAATSLGHVLRPRSQHQSSVGAFDAAESASPEGRWVAVRSFQGGDPRSPGAETLQLLEPAADHRVHVSTRAGATAIGWTRG